MKHLGEKEIVNVVIDEGQSSKSIVFVETYSEVPKVLIIETNGAVGVAINVTKTGCDIKAIDSKKDTKANTSGRTIKLSIIE